MPELNKLIFVDKILDSVHGFIRLTEVERRLEALPIFKRLSDIAQLGLVYRIFPGARHSRYLHSLGVMHIADKMAVALGQDSFFRQFIRLAGMLHDVGHYPFSHNVERVYLDYADYKAVAEHYPISQRQAFDLFMKEGRDQYKQQLKGRDKTPHHHEAVGAHIIRQNDSIREALINAFILFPPPKPEDEMTDCDLRELNPCFSIDYDALPEAENHSRTAIMHGGRYTHPCLRALCDRLCDDLGAVICGHLEANTSLKVLEDRLSLAIQMMHSEMDADNLDYLLHDAYFSGTTYGIMDIDMLIGTLKSRTVKIQNNGRSKTYYVLGIGEKGVGFVDQFFSNRYMAYYNVIYHKYVSVIGGMVMHCVMWLLAQGEKTCEALLLTWDEVKDIECGMSQILQDKFLRFTDSAVLSLINTVDVSSYPVETQKVFVRLRNYTALDIDGGVDVSIMEDRLSDLKAGFEILMDNEGLSYDAVDPSMWFPYRLEHRVMTEQMPKEVFSTALNSLMVHDNGTAAKSIDGDDRNKQREETRNKHRLDRVSNGVPVFSMNADNGAEIELKNIELIVDIKKSMLQHMCGMQYCILRKYRFS